MFGQSGEVLYVGKAKDLRARLLSYRRAKPHEVSRKVIRMLNLIARIEWDVCESEQAALLRENRLLRHHRPPFNVVNTHPDQYYLIALEALGSRDSARFTLFLTTQPKPVNSRTELFGAFKGRARARDAVIALNRLLWACHSELPERFEFPMQLTRRNPPRRFELEIGAPLSTPEISRWLRLLKQFLNGTSRSLINRMTERLLQRDEIPSFYNHLIQQDLNSLDEFFQYSAHRNKRLRRAHGLTTSLIAQDEIDDLIVKSRS